MQAELSHQQRHFWLLHQAADDPSTYNNSLNVVLTGDVDVACLKESIKRLALTYPVYRTLFHTVDGEPEGHIEDVLPSFTTKMWNQSKGDFRSWAISRINIEKSKAFQLDKDCPLRACLYQENEHSYIFTIVLHHIAHDGSAYRILWEALVSIYEALSEGRGLPEVPAEHLYQCYVTDQKLSKRATDLSLSYWSKRLGDPFEPLSFPFDYPESSDEGDEQAQFYSPIPVETFQMASRFASDLRTTPTVIYMAVYFIWLSRYANTRDIAVGLPFVGRSSRADQKVLGCCMNLLCMRQKVNDQETFSTLVQSTRRLVLEGLMHAKVPFLELVQHLNPVRHGSNTLHNTTFQYRNWVSNYIPMGEAKADALVLPRRRTEFPIGIEIHPDPERPLISISFDTRRFRRETIERMLHHYNRLTASAISNPEARLSDLEMWDSSERESLVLSCENKHESSCIETTVHQLVAVQAKATPNAVAVIHGETAITYADLVARAKTVAQGLSEAGVEPGDLVGIRMGRSENLVLALLGIFFSGAGYVPIDPTAPPERQTYVCHDSGMKLLLLDDQEETTSEVRTLHWDHLSSSSEGPTASRDHQPNDIAYVTYTSGTTNQPKGVIIEHRSVVNLLQSMAVEPGLSQEDTLLALTSISFDISVLELFLTLIRGAKLIVGSVEMAQSPNLLAGEIERNEVTVLQATPSGWRLLQESGWSGRSGLKAMCGGEPLSPDLANFLARHCDTAWNLYGPTETTIWSSCGQVMENKPVRLGAPIANTQLMVVDENLQLVPYGVPGELLIGGDGVARAYQNKEEQTRERFVTLPNDKGDSRRYFRTGDRVKLHGDCSLEYLGRLDNQLKIRGFRVEPGEIEAAISDHPDIANAFVMSEQDSQSDPELSAYLISVQENPSVAELRSFLANKIPNYMIPVKWAFVESIPRTINGKVDRRELRRTAISYSDTPSEEARDELELAMVTVWEDALSRSPIGIHDNFFHIGGHSIMAMKIMGRIRNQLNVDLPMSAILRNPTIADLASLVREQGVGDRS